MALSGSYENNLQGFVVQTEWEVTQNVTSNYSDLTVNLYLTINKNYSLYINSRTHTVTINGTKHYVNSSPINLQGYKKNYLGTVKKRIYHNSDGTLTVDFSTYFDLKATINGVYTSSIDGGSRSFTLDKIPRMSTINDTMQGTRYLGTEHTITLDTNFSDVTHTIWYRIKGDKGASTWYKIADGIRTTATFTPTDAHCNLQPNNITIFMDLRCRTYRNGKQLGTDSYSNGWYMKVPTSYVPTISSVNITETVDKIKALGVYVQNHSRIKVTTVSSGVAGSIIKSIKAIVDDREYTGSSITTQEVETSGNVTIKVIVKDSRGRTATKIETIRVEEYHEPKIIEFYGGRSDGAGRLDEDGRYVKLKRKFKIATLGDNNPKEWKIEKKVLGATQWTTLGNSTGNYADDSFVEYPNISADYSYEIKLTLTDFNSTVSKSFIIHTSFSLIDFHKGGRGIAFGKSATLEEGVDFDMFTQFRKDIEVRQEAEFKKIPKINGTPIIRKPQTVALQSGWIRNDSTQPMRIIKDFNGIVHFQGELKNGTTDKETVLFNLPEIYRPKITIYCKALANDYSTSVLAVYSSGKVVIKGGNPTEMKKWLCLDGISYFVD